jgi:hypothetical protein
VLAKLTPPAPVLQVPLERWDVEALSAASLPARFGGWLPGIEAFDAALFNVGPGCGERLGLLLSPLLR